MSYQPLGKNTKHLFLCCNLENDSNYATEVFVTTKIAEASLSGGEVDLSGFATKDDLPKSLSELINDMDFTTKQYVDETTAINVKNISYDTNINPKTFIDCLNEIIIFFTSNVIIYDNKIKFYHILRGKNSIIHIINQNYLVIDFVNS